jgi:hypothetical protein
MPRPKPNSLPPSAVQKECQRVVHVVAYDIVFKRKSLTDEQKKNMLYLLVHGTNDAGSDHHNRGRRNRPCVLLCVRPLEPIPPILAKDSDLGTVPYYVYLLDYYP